MEVVELADGRKVFAPMGVDPDGPRACRRTGEDRMMIIPAGAKVHLALG
jgi:hypothetical protein